MELKAYLHYRHDRRTLSYWRSKSGYEVDFLIGDKIAIEVKGTDTVCKKHTKGLLALSEDLPLEKKIIVSLDLKKRTMDDIEIYPYRDFLKMLWADELLI